VNLVCNNFGRAALYNQDTLVVVLLNNVGVGEGFNVDVQCFFVFFDLSCRHYFGSFYFRGLERGIRRARFLDSRDEFYVYFSSPADVSDRVVSQLNA